MKYAYDRRKHTKISFYTATVNTPNVQSSIYTKNYYNQFILVRLCVCAVYMHMYIYCKYVIFISLSSTSFRCHFYCNVKLFTFILHLYTIFFDCMCLLNDKKALPSSTLSLLLSSSSSTSASTVKHFRKKNLKHKREKKKT